MTSPFAEAGGLRRPRRDADHEGALVALEATLRADGGGDRHQLQVLEHRHPRGGAGREVARDEGAGDRCGPAPRHEDHGVGHAEVQLDRFPVEVVVERAAVRRHQHVATLDAGARGGAPRRHARHHEPVGRAPVFEVLGWRHVQPGPGAAHGAGGQEEISHAERPLDGDRKAEPDRAAAVGEDRGIDADHLAERVGQRPARVAGVDGGIGLDHVEVEPGLPLGRQDVPASSAHDAGGHRRLGVAEVIGVGVAEGHDPFADHELAALAQRHGGEAAPGHLDDRDVGDGVRADEPRGELGAVAEGDGDRLGPGHDVLVGEDDAVAPDDEAGAGAANELGGVPGDEHVGPRGAHGHLLARRDADGDDGRREALDGGDDGGTPADLDRGLGGEGGGHERQQEGGECGRAAQRHAASPEWSANASAGYSAETKYNPSGGAGGLVSALSSRPSRVVMSSTGRRSEPDVHHRPDQHPDHVVEEPVGDDVKRVPPALVPLPPLGAPQRTEEMRLRLPLDREGPEVVLAGQRRRGLPEQDGVERAPERPFIRPPERGHGGGVHPDFVPVLAAERALSRMEPRDGRPHPLHPAVTREERVHGSAHRVRLPFGRQREADAHPDGVDPGVRSPRAVRHHPPAREALQHALDLGLDGPAGCLSLPAEKAAAIEVQLGKKSPAHRREI